MYTAKFIFGAYYLHGSVGSACVGIASVTDRYAYPWMFANEMGWYEWFLPMQHCKAAVLCSCFYTLR